MPRAVGQGVEEALSTRLRQTPATTLDSWISEALAEQEAEGDKTGIRRISLAEEAAEPLIPSSLLPPARPSGTYELVELSGVLEGDDIDQLRRPAK